MQLTGPKNNGLYSDPPRFDNVIFKDVPEDAGPRIATLRGGAVHVIRPPGSQKVVQTDYNLISVMLAPAQGLQSAIGSDKLHAFDAEIGTIVITPAGVDAQVIWPHTRENATLILPPEALQELVEREFDSSRTELQLAPFGTVDPWALQIARLLKTELMQKDAANELYIDSLVTIFGVHVLRHYAGIRKPVAKVTGGLSIRQAQRVRDHMEANFTRRLTVAELASVAGLSPHYFIHVFAKTFGKPPHQYVVDLRLDAAEKLLLQGNLTITEVAYLSGFSNQSHLTTAMKKHRNVTPMQLQRISGRIMT